MNKPLIDLFADFKKYFEPQGGAINTPKPEPSKKSLKAPKSPKKPSKSNLEHDREILIRFAEQTEFIMESMPVFKTVEGRFVHREFIERLGYLLATYRHNTENLD